MMDPEENYTEDPGFPLNYEEDANIIMHRDCHFAGQFSIMLEYYENEGIGIAEDISIERIRELAAYEEQFGTNLATLLLTGSDAEKVAEVRAVYKTLREIYEVRNPKHRYPLLIADLVLTEEAIPEEEMAAIIAEKGAIVPSLIELIDSDEYYDPLYPGYGLAPGNALACLQKIGDKRAIIALFESIGRHDFFNEDVAISALWHIGEPAKEFLLKVLRSRTITEDNIRVAIALVAFEDDEEIAQACWDILHNLDVKAHPIFAGYLSLCCEGLTNLADRDAFRTLALTASVPQEVKDDMQTILHAWDS